MCNMVPLLSFTELSLSLDLKLLSGCDKPHFDEERRLSHEDDKTIRNSSVMEEASENDLQVGDTDSRLLSVAEFLHDELNECFKGYF